MFSHLYGPLPPQLVGKPAIVNVFGNKRARAEAWCGAELREVSTWATADVTNTVYVANMDLPPIDLRDLVQEEFAPGRGWMPVELPRRVLMACADFGMTVFDGFMGRGTIGKACDELGLSFVGIDIDPGRVEIAREYLGAIK